MPGNAKTVSVSTAPEIALAEQALRRATEWIDAKYGARFAGTWAVDGQALAWPRLYTTYRLAAFPDDEVPSQIIAATVQAAVRELAKACGEAWLATEGGGAVA